MARYIDVDKLLKDVKNATPMNWTNSEAEIQAQLDWKCFTALTKGQPTADVAEVKHGRWIRNECNIEKMKEFHKKGIALSMSEKSIFYTCSCCGSWGTLTQKHCSECGAKMDGGNEE